MPLSDAALSASLLLGEGVVVERVHAVRGVEEVSRPFWYDVDFSAQDADPDAVRGVEAQLLLEDSLGQTRQVRGVIERLTLRAVPEGALRMRARIVPTTAVLALRSGFRIFQDRSVPEIIREVLTDAGFESGEHAWQLSGKYLKQPFCVQYGESEWDFINRLAEHEGISYAFDGSGEVMVIRFFDDSSKAPSAEPEAVSFHPDGRRHAESVRAWDVWAHQQVTVSQVALGDYDLLRPSRISPKAAQAKAPASGAREWYEYPAGFLTESEGTELAKRRLELFSSEHARVQLSSNALGVAAGQRLRLDNEGPRDGDYFITRSQLTLTLDPESVEGPLVEAGPQQCELSIELLDAQTPYRPPRRTRRPKVTGLQTARVTGPKGEEIYCDELGRVKLQFPWDRQGELDEKTSAWVRVAQAHTTGSMLIPRIGWEVLVEFVDGDPDRPVCLGRLYNTVFPPPHALPGEKTKSGHQSHSSPGGGGTNAVVFEDAAGGECIDVRAQRDLNVEVANDKQYKVGKEDNRAVAVNRQAKIGGKEDLAVVGDVSLAVQGKETLTVGGGRTVRVNGAVGHGVKGNLEHSVGGAHLAQVGSPGAAVLQLLEEAAISAVKGLVSAAVEKAQAAVLAPLAPGLAAVKESLGPAAALLPAPAQALLSGDPSAVLAALEQGPPEGREALPPSESPSPEQEEAGRLAAGAAQAAADGPPPAQGEQGAAGGGGGGGGGAGGGGAAGAVGEGTWGVTIGGDVTETIGGLCAVNALGPIELEVGGASSETVGALRGEAIRGAKSETTDGSKVETVAGAYILDLGTSYSVDAGVALAETIAGAYKQKIAKGHELSTPLPVLLTAAKIKLTGKETITLKCGQAEIVISSDGIAIKGTEITIQGSKSLKLDPAAIAPG